ncbi:MAG TPA: ribonuclease HII [Clostridiales bacterium]|nr:ribonuclease HII [Clostridiales bacterium]
MEIHDALEYIEVQSKLYDLNLEPLKKKYLNLYEKYKLEKARLEEMSRYEKEGYAKGYVRIGGIDEAGRGPLAGPVVAACVVLKKDDFIPGIKDSKKMTEKARESVYEAIMEYAADFGVGIVDHHTIDDINILNATKKAMIEAIGNLKSPPEYLLIDALEIPDYNIPQKSIVKGDNMSVSIAAASIVAKVTRDRIMCRYAEEYPCYGFESNKGYGTADHIEAIHKYGICPLHRKLFVRNFL